MRPSRVRYVVVAFAFALSVITYVDRVAISSAAPAIASELHLSRLQLGAVFSAFTLAYALFEVPSGWWGDVSGARPVLTRIVTWWSIFTALTGMAWNFLSLVVFRFLFGAGEAGAFPNITRIFSRWMPASERGVALGAVLMGSRLGGSLTPFTVVALMTALGWRQSFAIFAALGIVWTMVFYAWFRDDPAEKSSVNAAEAALIRASVSPSQPNKHALPWRRLIRSGNLWAICLMYFCMFYGWYFYITWLPTYLREARGLSAAETGIYAGLPLLFGAFGCLIGGLLTDLLVAKFGLRLGRRTIGIACLSAAGAFLLAAVLLRSPFYAILAICLSAFANDMALSTCWAVCVDTGAEYAGTVSGCMNTFGNLGGTLSPLVVAEFLEHLHSWRPAFFVAAAVYAVGALLWLRIDPGERIVRDAGPAG